MIAKEKYDRANSQRLICLKAALEMIDGFAVPSLDPERFEAYENIKKTLITKYSKP